MKGRRWTRVPERDKGRGAGRLGRKAQARRAARAWACLWALLLVLLPAQAAAQAPAGVDLVQSEPFPLTRATLPNGLRVWVQPRADSESVTAMLVLRAGSRDETTANSGVSHFVEHMLFTGTERWSEVEIKEVIAKRGGRWNGWTGAETTTYFAHVAAQDLEIALDWLDQLVFHPTFPADEVGKEREVIFEEKSGHYGCLYGVLDRLGLGYELWREVTQALFPGSTLALRVVGEDASLESLDREALLAYYEAHYTPRNAVLVIAGSVQVEQVLARATELLGDAEGTAGPVPLEVPPMPQGGPYRAVVRGPMLTDQVTLMVGARTVGRAHADRWALAVLAEMLSKELTEELRYEQGLVYGVGAYNNWYADAGYFAVSTDSDASKTEAIRRAIEARIEEVRGGEVDAQSVADAQSALAGSWALTMEDTEARAGWLADWAFLLGPAEPVPDYLARIEAVTPQDLTRVVATYFTPERSFVGMHDPILTLAGAAWLGGGVLAAGLAAWGYARLRRRRGTA